MNLDFKNFQDFPAPVQGIIFGVFSLVFFIILYSIDVSGIQTELSQKKLQENELKTQVQALIKNNATIDKEIHSLPQVKKLFTEWQGTLHSAAEMPDFLNEILKKGMQSQIIFDVFNPGADISENQYTKLPIKMKLSGNYQQIGSFLSAMTNAPELVAITTLTIAKIPTVNDKNATQLTAELMLETYYTAGAKA